MAKAKNTTQVTGGLSALDGLDFDIPEDLDPGREVVAPAGQPKNSLTSGYRKPDKVVPKVRTNIMLDRSVKRKLDRAVKDEKIESMSGLINYLLEEYFENN